MRPLVLALLAGCAGSRPIEQPAPPPDVEALAAQARAEAAARLAPDAGDAAPEGPDAEADAPEGPDAEADAPPAADGAGAAGRDSEAAPPEVTAP